MSEPPTKLERPRKRLRRVRIALWVLAGVVPLAGGFAFRYYTRPHRVRAMAEAFLQRQVNGRVRVGEAKWSWIPNLRLFNVTIDDPADDAAEPGEAKAPIFFCPEVRLELSLASMLLGRPAVESIQAIEPSCAIVRDAGTGRFNVAGLLRPRDRGDDWDFSNLPNVELRDARIRLIDRSDDARRLVEDLTITVRARAWKSTSPGYDITWQVEQGKPTSGHARIDLSTGRVRSVTGGLPWMHVDAVALALSAKHDAVEAWRDVLGLTGNIRVKHFDLGGGVSDDATRSARQAGSTVVVELADAALSVPVGDEERALPVDQRYLRFDRVHGEVELGAQGLSARFSGLLHGSAFDVSATIRTGDTGLSGGFGDFESLGLEAEVTIMGVMLPVNDPAVAPEQARFIRNLPALAKVYADYDPHGLIDLSLSVSRPAGADQRLVLKRLHVTTHGADFSATKFPYRIRDAHGTIERTSDGEMTCALRGLGRTIEPGLPAGTISIDGTFGRVAKGHEKRVTISGENVPLDDAFWRALPPRFERVRRQFSPSGLVDLEVVLKPTETIDPLGKKWQSRTTVSLLDVSGTYDRFPYPVENITGTIVIDRGSVTVTDLVGRSDQAIVSIDGSLVVGETRQAGHAGGSPGGADGLNYINLTIQGRSVPIDDRLMAALPERTRREVEVFHPQGTFDSRTSLSFNTRTRRVEHASVVSLNGVAVRCDHFPLPITNITGQLRITDRQAADIPTVLGFTGTETRFENLSGRFCDATIEVNGVSRRGVEGSSLEATVRAHDIRLDEQARRWLPASVLDQIGSWGIEGPIATETVLTGDPTRPGGLSQHTRVTLTGVTVTHPRLPIPATDVRGELVIDQTGLRSTRLTAKYNSAEVLFTFDADEAGESGGCGVSEIRATGLTLNDSVRDLLPPRLSGAWSRVNPAGRLGVYLDEVQCRQSPDAAAPQYTIRGRVELDDVSLGHEGFITRSNGIIELEGVINDVDGGTLLRGTLALDRTDVFDHRIDQATGDWSYACTKRGDGMLVLRPVRGRIHDGLISGEVDLEFTPDRLEYSVTSTVRNMRLESFLGSTEARGTVHGHLQVTGTVDGESSPRGSGRFEIVDGHMYRLPLILGILHVLNLSVPGKDAFDEASADFLIVGDRIELKDIRLRGEALALRGTGELSWPDRSVDLTLVNVNRDAWTREVPLLGDLIAGASRELVGLHVTGKLSKPKIRLEPFRAIRKELQSLFKKKKPKQTQTVGP